MAKLKISIMLVDRSGKELLFDQVTTIIDDIIARETHAIHLAGNIDTVGVWQERQIDMPDHLGKKVI